MLVGKWYLLIKVTLERMGIFKSCEASKQRSIIMENVIEGNDIFLNQRVEKLG